MKAVGETLIQVEAVSKRFCRRGDRMARYGVQDLLGDLFLRQPQDRLRDGEFWALRDINLTVRRGDVIGLVGHNGAGKSSLLRLLSGIYKPTLGSITVHTNRIAILDHSAGLNPAQTGRECIHTKLALLGLQPGQISDRVDGIIAMAELRDVIDTSVGTYSTGMRVRLAFAIYASVEIDIFIVDDSLGVADVRFAQRMQRYWQDYVAAGGTLLLATHEMYLMRTLCRQALWFDHGRILASGDTDAVVAEYLLKSMPSETPEPTLPGNVQPDLPTPDGAAPGASAAQQSEPLAGIENAERYIRFSRTGNFPVRITAIETEARPDVGARTAQVLGQLCVRIHCISEIAADTVTFGLEIVDAQGRVAIHVIGPDAAPHFTLVEGANTLHATLLNLPLMPGNYTIRVGLSDARDKSILGMRGWEESPEPLQVVPGFSNDLLGAIDRGALMAAPVVWRTGQGSELAGVCMACNAAPIATPHAPPEG